MTARRIAALLSCWSLAVGCATTTTSAPTVNTAAYNATISEAAKKHMRQFERLQNVWFRLTSANSGQCEKTRLMSGFWYAYLPTASQPYRSAWTARYGPSEYMTVTHVAAGSPAHEAGLRAGDLIVARDGKELGTGRRANRRMNRSFRSHRYSLTVLRDRNRVTVDMRRTRR